ncbi:MAG TPA: hypothetical protein VH186_12115, partial [Chloroflexia bacterium]|nr:hypothetical protein [Chloroflexia bacterium]
MTENGRALSNSDDPKTWPRPIDWLRNNPDFKLVDKVVVQGQRDRDNKATREIQLWQRVGPNVPPYKK